MNTRFVRVLALILVASLLTIMPDSAQTQVPTQPVPLPTMVQPRLEPIAETKLIMEGLAQANFKGLEKLLAQQPKDAQAWTFARGQALLLAETGNLLMLRPPKNAGEPVWFQRTMEFRTQAMQLAQAMGQKDYARGKVHFVNLANTCNRCHQSFRVQVQITPFEEQQPLPKVE